MFVIYQKNINISVADVELDIENNNVIVGSNN